jgi:DNA (cytosine-5)-methyltransferase 1
MNTVGGLFSGIGGIETGFEKAGFKILWSNENDPYSIRSFKNNYKHTLYEDDIRKLNFKKIKAVDVLVGGFPCQAFSVAGYQKGFKDPRGNLFFEICRAITELPKKPEVLVLENVKNIRGHDGGKTAKVITKSLRELGYSVFWNLFNTSIHTEIPQNRERTFIICFKDEADWEFQPNKKSRSSIFNSYLPLSKSKNKKNFRELLETAEVEDRYYYKQNAYMYKDLKKSINSKNTVYQWRRIYVRENKSGECPTLTANMGTGGHNVPLIKDDLGIRKLTPRECLNFQGFPQNFKFPSDMPISQRYKQTGNAVTVNLIKKIAKIIKTVL